jgi:DEAD/DEAH box helicase domain-containing protein
MPTLANVINKWRSNPLVGGNITAWEILPAQKAKFIAFPESLHPALLKALNHLGFTKLYTHQLESWKLVQERNNIAIVTGTASGKTLCYNIPVLHDLLIKPDSNALYLFPTKALAQDQLSALKKINLYLQSDFVSALGINPIMPATYDGDTPKSSREAIRNKSRLILSNPDMLHAGILPHHTRWDKFFQGLQFVVIDEIHTYRGVFGSHVANIIRRLKRIATFYGASIQFILTSATIGNPAELASKLIEEQVSLVDNDGSARGEKQFLIYNPPIIDRNLGLRAPLLQESRRLALDLMDHQIQTIIFGRTRRTVELLLTYLRTKTFDSNDDVTNTYSNIRAYRSGYLPKQRREIEAGLRNGIVRVVIATTALELGIDIGQMEASILVGYPGTISGTWQQAGRAGRGQKPSLTILIASPGPLDQFLSRNPEYFFKQPPEDARIDPNNLLILVSHLLCAAYELPFNTNDCYGDLDSIQTLELLEFLRNSGTIHRSGQKFFWMADRFPASDVSLRNVSNARFTLQEVGSSVKTIGEVDGESAFWMVHPGAIYIHEGVTYLVQELDIDNKIAFLQQTTVDYYTRIHQETDVQILNPDKIEVTRGGQISHGDISVTTLVKGYHKTRWDTHEKLGYHELSLPPSTLLTTAYWFMVEKNIVEKLRETGLWSNDPNDYGTNWKTQRDLARKRDNFKCQVCGLLEENKPHHVHHITPLRLFESSFDSNALNNLITLCPACHKRAETNVRIRSGLAGLAYILWNLTPLFLMCDTRDIGIHNDSKSPLNNGLPIIVIYDSIPGGLGFSQHLFSKHSELFSTARHLAAGCKCKDGCPSCVGPGGEFGAGSKKETLAILELITDNNK